MKADAQRHELGGLAKLVILIGVLLIIAGVIWHGVTFETF